MRLRGSRAQRGSGDGRERASSPALLRHPRRVLALSLVFVTALGVLGADVEGKLSPTSLDIPGTGSSRANSMLREHFGDSAPFVILLRGPREALDRQGPKLVDALRRDPVVTTLSPWDLGSVQRLRPGPRRAIVIADFHVPIDVAVNETVPELNRILEQQIRPPVRQTQTGFATLSRAIQDDSIDATERGELIALPILLIVLLLVFRSPVAAAIPLVFGAGTVIASRGLLSILTNWFDVDAFVLSFEEGVVKPDKEIFAIACERIGVDPAETLMVGDSEEADGGARALGCEFALVDPLPTADRPDALLTALRGFGIG